MKNLILIEAEEKYQFDTIEELIKCIIDENYYEISEIEKKEKLKLKAYANCIKTDFQIVSNFETNETLDNKFFILDEITYIYSLLLLNKVHLLESTDANILTKDLDKTSIKDNYIIVNHFAKELLKSYMERSGYND